MLNIIPTFGFLYSKLNFIKMRQSVKAQKVLITWPLVLISFIAVVLFSLFTNNENYGLINSIAMSVGAILIPSLIILLVRYAKYSKLDIREALFYGSVITCLLQALNMIFGAN